MRCRRIAPALRPTSCFCSPFASLLLSCASKRPFSTHKLIRVRWLKRVAADSGCTHYLCPLRWSVQPPRPNSAEGEFEWHSLAYKLHQTYNLRVIHDVRNILLISSILLHPHLRIYCYGAISQYWDRLFT